MKSNKVIGICLLMVSLLLTVTACSSLEKQAGAESMYLLEVIHKISTADHVVPSNHPLLHDSKEYNGEKYGLKPGLTYLWFTMSPQSINAMQKSKISSADATTSFAGFFLVIDESRKIVDFGWHKP